MEILDGKKISSEIKDEIRQKIDSNYISLNKTPPCLACIIVGNNPASEVYVASKEKACKNVGMGSKVFKLPEQSTEQDVINLIKELNENIDVSAILLQLPLPNGLNERKIINQISPSKDADGLTDISLGKLFSKTYDVAPCTAIGIIDILKRYNIEISGKNAVVVGRSLLVGKSVAVLLEEQNATVTVCHSKTINLQSITKNADILIVAMGKPNFIGPDHIKEGAIVIDVGINRLSDGLVGDVDFKATCNKCSYITPVPGGVGPMTIAELLNNTLMLHELSN